MSSIELNNPINCRKTDRFDKDLNMNLPKEDYISGISQKIEELRNSCWSNLGVSRTQKNMIQLLKNLKSDISELNSNPLLINLEKLEIDQKIKLCEPNRRGLNLLLDLKNRQITTLLLLKHVFSVRKVRRSFRDDYPLKDKKWICHSRQQSNRGISKRFIKISISFVSCHCCQFVQIFTPL